MCSEAAGACRLQTLAFFKAMASLERVIGTTSFNNATFLVNRGYDDEVVSAAGCTVVAYSAAKNQQTRFFQAPRPATAIAVTPDGGFLAVGLRGAAAGAAPGSPQTGPSSTTLPVLALYRYDGRGSSGDGAGALGQSGASSLLRRGDGSDASATSSGLVGPPPLRELCVPPGLPQRSSSWGGVAAAAFSPGGRFLVAAGFKADKTLGVWDWQTGRCVAWGKLAQRIAAVSFSPDGSFFVTAGDRHLKVWAVAPVLAAASSGEGGGSNSPDELVLPAGDVVWLPPGALPAATPRGGRDGETGSTTGAAAAPASTAASTAPPVLLTSAPAAMSETGREFESFVDAAVAPPSSSGAASPTIFALTSAGILCCFTAGSDGGWCLNRWVHTRTRCGYSLDLVTLPLPDGAASSSSSRVSLLVIGCADGIVRVFNSSTLGFVCTLPLPAAVGRHGTTTADPLPAPAAGGADVYPAALAVRASGDGRLAAVVYGDRSTYVWDMSEVIAPSAGAGSTGASTSSAAPPRVIQYRCLLCHAGPVLDVDTVKWAGTGAAGGQGAFVTAGADATVRVWALPPTSGRAGTLPRGAPRNLYSRDLLAALYVEDQDELEARAEAVLAGSGGAAHPPLEAVVAAAGLNACTPRSLKAGSLPTLRVVTHEPVDAEAAAVSGGVSPKADSGASPDAGCITRVATHPTARQLACGDKEGNLRIYELGGLLGPVSAGGGPVSSSPRLLRYEVAHDEAVTALSYSPASGTLLVSGSSDKLIHVFDTREQPSGSSSALEGTRRYEVVSTLGEHKAGVTALAFTPDEAALVSADGGGALVISKITAGGAGSGEAPSSLSLVNQTGASADVSLLSAAGGAPAAVPTSALLRDGAAAGPLTVTRQKTVTCPSGPVAAVDVDPGAKNFLTVGGEAKVAVWSLRIGRVTRWFGAATATAKEAEGAPGATATRLAVDPSGLYALVVTSDASARLYDVFSGACLGRLGGHGAAMTAARFTPDCRRVITSSLDGTVYVWRLPAAPAAAMVERCIEIGRLPPSTAAAAGGALADSVSGGGAATGSHTGRPLLRADSAGSLGGGRSARARSNPRGLAAVPPPPLVPPTVSPMAAVPSVVVAGPAVGAAAAVARATSPLVVGPAPGSDALNLSAVDTSVSAVVAAPGDVTAIGLAESSPHVVPEPPTPAPLAPLRPGVIDARSRSVGRRGSSGTGAAGAARSSSRARSRSPAPPPPPVPAVVAAPAPAVIAPVPVPTPAPAPVPSSSPLQAPAPSALDLEFRQSVLPAWVRDVAASAAAPAADAAAPPVVPAPPPLPFAGPPGGSRRGSLDASVLAGGGEGASGGRTGTGGSRPASRWANFFPAVAATTTTAAAAAPAGSETSLPISPVAVPAPVPAPAPAPPSSVSEVLGLDATLHLGDTGNSTAVAGEAAAVQEDTTAAEAEVVIAAEAEVEPSDAFSVAVARTQEAGPAVVPLGGSDEDDEEAAPAALAAPESTGAVSPAPPGTPSSSASSSRVAAANPMRQSVSLGFLHRLQAGSAPALPEVEALSSAPASVNTSLASHGSHSLLDALAAPGSLAATADIDVSDLLNETRELQELLECARKAAEAEANGAAPAPSVTALVEGEEVTAPAPEATVPVAPAEDAATVTTPAAVAPAEVAAQPADAPAEPASPVATPAVAEPVPEVTVSTPPAEPPAPAPVSAAVALKASIDALVAGIDSSKAQLAVCSPDEKADLRGAVLQAMTTLTMLLADRSW